MEIVLFAVMKIVLFAVFVFLLISFDPTRKIIANVVGEFIEEVVRWRAISVAQRIVKFSSNKNLLYGTLIYVKLSVYHELLCEDDLRLVGINYESSGLTYKDHRVIAVLNKLEIVIDENWNINKP